MLTVSSLSRAQLGARLAGPGIHLHTGAFVVHLSTSIETIADAVHLLYGDYRLQEQAPFSDFHIRMTRPLGPRRWYRPQVNFLYDEIPVFRPLPFAHAFPMFEWGLNWAVANHAHSYLILHAAVIEKTGWRRSCRPRPAQARAPCARPWCTAAGACCPTNWP